MLDDGFHAGEAVASRIAGKCTEVGLLRKVWRAGEVAGLGQGQLSALFERRRVPDGRPLLLGGVLRLVEPLCSWCCRLALDRMDPKSMKVYVYTALMLVNFLRARRIMVGER
ncbi:hypothetical protein [Streptomyces chrestomyceticus]|uniref:hypothetical protein n=1 Tax=Streptomyces chrestomyceticus TaxID=68185 RepID=UPI0033FAA042